MTWRNRIMGSAELSPLAIAPHPENWRQHPAAQHAALSGALRELGWIQQVVISKRSGRLIDGHLRVALALQAEEATIPVLFVDLSEDEERLALVTLDPIAALAEANTAALSSLLQQVQSGDAAMQAFLSALAVQQGIVPPETAAGGGQAEEGPAPQVDRAEALRAQWGVEVGQLWQLGRHRLICGDCTDKAGVTRLLGRVVPVLMVTDPPYGVEYDSEWRVRSGVSERTRGKKILNDDRADWTEAWALFPGNIAYVWHASMKTVEVAASLHACRFEPGYLLIWNKDSLIFGRGDYHHKYEPCWYMIRHGKPHHWRGDRKQTTVWDIPSINSFATRHNPGDNAQVGHGTQKPIECMARPIRNHEAPTVYDPFLGSGSTLIACEQLGRGCYACEIDPGYLSVALQRWADLTGQTPVLLADERTP